MCRGLVRPHEASFDTAAGGLFNLPQINIRHHKPRCLWTTQGGK